MDRDRRTILVQGLRDHGLRQKTDTWFASVLARVTHSPVRGGVGFRATYRATANSIQKRSIRVDGPYVIGVADSTARLIVSPRESHPVQ